MRADGASRDQFETLARLLGGGSGVGRREWRGERAPCRPAAVMLLAPLLGLVIWVGLLLAHL